MSIIKSKRRRPESLGYNSWMPLAFPVITLAASTAPTTVEARIPLALNVKIVAVSYVLSGSLAGGTSFNIALGAGSYETAGSSAFGGSTLGGTFAAGDQVIFVIGGVSYTFNVTARTAGSLVKLASGIARSINKNAALNGTYIASQSGNTVIVQTLAYSTAGNSTTFTTSVVSASGTSTALGSTLSGGASGTVPVVPPNDTTQIGIVPPTVASAGQALFPVDMYLENTADVPSVLYPGAYDAIFPSAGELTLRLATQSGTTGTLNVVLWAVPVDVHPMQPEEAAEGFLPGLLVI